MLCKQCGSSMRRLARTGFLQQRVYPIFGFYPWECPVCRKPIMLKKQYRRKMRSIEQTSAE